MYSAANSLATCIAKPLADSAALKFECTDYHVKGYKPADDSYIASQHKVLMHACHVCSILLSQLYVIGSEKTTLIAQLCKNIIRWDCTCNYALQTAVCFRSVAASVEEL